MVDTTDTEAIERDLAETRARMDHRLDELQVRLSPAQMINDALANFTGGDGAEFTQNVITKIKANPLPAALAGVGLAWLMASSSTRTGPTELYEEPSFAARLEQAEAGAAREPGEDTEAHGLRLDAARGKALASREKPRTLCRAMASASRTPCHQPRKAPAPPRRISRPARRAPPANSAANSAIRSRVAPAL